VYLVYRIPKRVLHVNLETTRPRQDGRIVGGEEWQEKSI
jgi:hypothetical protein